MLCRTETLDDGRGPRPVVLSESITHLAFSSGWGKYDVGGLRSWGDVFARGAGFGTRSARCRLGTAPSPRRGAEAERASQVKQQVGTVAPGVVPDTRPTSAVPRPVVARPVPRARDRSLVARQRPHRIRPGTRSFWAAWIAAIDNGLTQTEAAKDVMARIAFFAGRRMHSRRCRRRGSVGKS